jgi:hypothetical protein
MARPGVPALPGTKDEGIPEQMSYYANVGKFTHTLKAEVVAGYLKKLSTDQGLTSEARQYVAENYWGAVSRKSKEAQDEIGLLYGKEYTDKGLLIFNDPEYEPLIDHLVRLAMDMSLYTARKLLTSVE